MKKNLFTILLLLTVPLVLSGCGGEQAAPKKAAVDVKPKKPALPQSAQSAASKAAAPASNKAEPDAPKVAAASNKPPADAEKPTSAAPTKSAAEKPSADAQTATAEKADVKKPGADAKKPGPDAQVAGKANGGPDELPPPLAVPKGYRYQPRGRRDPFVNPIPKPVTAQTIPVARPDGLPGVLVSELKVSGIVYSRDPAMKKAILAAGRKTYFAKQGDRLFDAVIKEIRPSEVVFTMVSTATKKPLNRETVVSTGGPNSGRR